MRSWKWGSHDGIGALVGGLRELALSPLGRKVAVCKPGRGPSPETEHAGPLISDVQLPELKENKFLLRKPLS
jgi:hypothetical protein